LNVELSTNREQDTKFRDSRDNSRAICRSFDGSSFYVWTRIQSDIVDTS